MSDMLEYVALTAGILILQQQQRRQQLQQQLHDQQPQLLIREVKSKYESWL